MSAERIEKLQEFLKRDPADGFALFAVAMEFVGQKRFEESLPYFDRLFEVDPDHVTAYFQKAKVLAKLGRYDQVRETIQAGLPRAQASGQFHARDKMQELLDDLENAK